MKTQIPVRQVPSKSKQNEAIDYVFSKGDHKPQETPPISHDKEEKVSQEPENDKGVTMAKFYFFIILAFSVIVFLSVTKYQVNEQRIKANTEIQRLENSTGAQIGRLLQEKSVNQKAWEREEKLKELAHKQIDSSMIKQAEYNASTYRIDEEIKKFGISVTQ